MEYESPEDGYIAKIISKEGETANVNQLVAIISDDLTFTQEDINNFLKIIIQIIKYKLRNKSSRK